MFDMIGNIFKNMASKPATRQYPKEKRVPFKDARGHISINIDNCIFCGICSRKCPSNAITVNRNDKTWEINPYKCIICNECVGSCPKKCVVSNVDYNPAVLVKEKRKYVQPPKPVQEGAPSPAAPARPVPAAAKAAPAADGKVAEAAGSKQEA
jgi:formate hydrogenlyase subunit 6/NADH:ubiquinone oxidoreductase subunit I